MCLARTHARTGGGLLLLLLVAVVSSRPTVRVRWVLACVCCHRLAGWWRGGKDGTASHDSPFFFLSLTVAALKMLNVVMFALLRMQA